ncbi:MAG: hypothetical protein U9N57_01260 [Pseudomonadota bacterium]|nr:hypothetical protein [Pseudomonadota bacterium]
MTALQEEIIKVLKSLNKKRKPVALTKICKQITITRHASRVRLSLEDLESMGKVVVINGEFLYLPSQYKMAS